VLKPDLDIIRSPSAETFLRSVTDGFYNRSFLGLWMYEVIGREWDEMAAWSNDLKQEIFVQTCTWSIAIWEWVYGFEPDESLTLEERRQRILRKVLGVRPINPEVLRRGISEVAGADAGVTDFTAPYTFGVTLNVTNGPIPMERVLQYIFEHKPAHLATSIEIVFPEIESTLHVGGSTGNHTIISIPREPDVYDFQNTLRTGGSVGAIASVGVREEPDVYDFRDTLHAGWSVGAAASVSVPKAPDVYDFRDTLHTGGSTGAVASVGMQEKPDVYDFQNTLHTGGDAAAGASIAIPGKSDDYDFNGMLHAGGAPALQAARPIPWDTSQPPATTILRTGGVCTIISNIPPRGE